MISKPPPCKHLNIRIPILIPIKGRELINQESGLCPTTVPRSEGELVSPGIYGENLVVWKSLVGEVFR